MAFTKEQKKEMISSYETWLKDSKATYVMAYHKMPVQMIQEIRTKAREIGGELHVVKNTLMNLAIENTGFENTGIFDEASMVAFAFQDAPSMAKIVNEASKTESFKIKGGYMDGASIAIEDIKTLAELPPMPEMRAMLLALIQTPATQLVRTILEPARQVAAVVKAYSEKEPAPSAG